ncbi:MAG: hypothetical protein JW923_08745 [Spirochaetales bacterium]|nr:hypothetical protein [Spirochaetales bacterium]
MKRAILCYICAALELGRYFILTYGASLLLALADRPSVVRLLAAPNLMFVLAFFFLGYDHERYSAYRPLVLVGKAVSVFAGLVVAGLVLVSGQAQSMPAAGLLALGAVLAWDAASALMLFFLVKDDERARADAPHQASIETVESD